MRVFQVLRVIGTMSFAVLFGCSGEYARTEPPMEELEGAWVVDWNQSTYRGSAVEVEHAGILYLRADGTFTAQQLPGAALALSDALPEVISGQGVWRLDSYLGIWTIFLEWSKRSDLPQRNTENLLFVRSNGTLTLEVQMGDPDARHFILLVKNLD